MTDPKPSTPRLPASDRRRQLIESALDLFSQRGFSGTTTKEIASATGVTEAIVFRHFASKQVLYDAVIDAKHDSGEVAAIVAQWETFMGANDDEGLFRAIIHRIIRDYRLDARMNRVLLLAALEGHEAGLDHYRKRTFPLFEHLCRYVVRRQAEGALRAGMPEAIVVAVVGAASYYAQMTSLFGFQTGWDDLHIQEQFIQLLMNGIKAQA
jgi:TetR/AcrR family transcriptional regulator